METNKEFEEVVEETVVETEEVVETASEGATEESTEEVVTEETSEETTEESTEETPDVVVEESVEETVEEVVETTETPEVTEEFVEDGTDDDEDDDEDDKENFSETVEQTEVVKPSKYSIAMSDGTIKEFELTLDDITYAIFNLVNNTYGEADNTYYYVSVYESNYVIMHDCWNGRAFKQNFTREGDNFDLIGDRVEVYANWLTKEEESSLAEMRSNYASLVQFKADTENAKLHAQREAILYDAKYSVLAEKDENNEYKNEAYAKLVSEMDKYSLTDLEKELKSVFADHITNGGQFAYVGEEKATVTKKLFASSSTKKTSRYGNLFNK